MTNTNIRGASQIGDTEFLAAYNNSTLDNAAVLSELCTDWTAVGVKLRSPRLVLHTTVNRVGGSKGTWEARPEPLAYEAQIWKKNGTIQQQPPSGGYVSLQERVNSGVISIDADLNVAVIAAPAVAPAAAAETTLVENPTAGADASAPALATEPVTASTGPQFAFEAEIFGQNYRLAGPSKDDALHALFVKLQEMNFSKVMITNRATGSTVGINDIQNGGRYKLAKQLTAASTPAWIDLGNAMKQALRQMAN